LKGVNKLSVLVTALLFKMEEANIASRAKAQEFIQATSQLSLLTVFSVLDSVPKPVHTSVLINIAGPSSTIAPAPPRLSPPSYFCTTPLTCTPVLRLRLRSQGSVGVRETWYLKKLHTQERAVEEVKLAIKPYYQRKDINKDEYKDILRKAVHKICHSRTGEINPVKVSNLVKLYVQRYKYFRKHGRKMDDDRDEREPGGLI
uniref:SFR19-like C-terminal domain-containing protein n=1 Tax=Neogobius melanostomus TaxID=47308 RepID=A0A8C6UUG2_9GOBI